MEKKELKVFMLAALALGIIASASQIEDDRK
jgi:hypothetical protein